MLENLEKRLKRQIHGKLHHFTAIVPLGFETTLVKELRLMGIDAENDSFETADGKVFFTAKITEAWKVVAHSRIANRILMDIASFKAENFRELEKKAAEIPWELYLPPVPVTPDTVPVHVTCKHSRLYHSDAVAERFYDVIKGGSLPLATASAFTSCVIASEAKQSQSNFFAKASATPSAGTPRNAPPQDKSSPQNLFVTLIDDRCTVSLDLAGEELYKRGHQRYVNDAPLKETIAAAMLFEAFEQVQSPTALIDPMAGSGTFSLEAAYMTNGLIPGKCRDFALKHQPAFKEATWNYIVNSALRKNGVSNLSLRGNEVTVAITSPIHKILTSDISDTAIEIIKHNIEASPLPKNSINPEKKDFFGYTSEEIAKLSGESQTVIVLNPPYGKRLDANAPKLYADIGKKLSEFKSCVVAILAPKGACSDNLLKNCAALGLSGTKLIKTNHGGISLNCFIGKIF